MRDGFFATLRQSFGSIDPYDRAVNGWTGVAFGYWSRLAMLRVGRPVAASTLFTVSCWRRSNVRIFCASEVKASQRWTKASVLP